ncbi:hypothetical protein [Thermomonas alba]|uniref:hypothetical protein n=1 Tax=Thermomonas alba TaxID=2888525 RepID=UPI001F0479C6|nr:hypothetical protein [Thermomonas alba]
MQRERCIAALTFDFRVSLSAFTPPVPAVRFLSLREGIIMHSWFKAIAAAALLLFSSASFAGETVSVPEGTELRLRLMDKLVSGVATEGERFNLELDTPLIIDGHVVAEPGAKAVGTVITSKKKGFMGKGGELNVMVDYLLVKGQRIKLRAAKSGHGEDKVGATVALTVLFGPLGLLKRGHNIELNPGLIIPAFVDQTTQITL